MGRFTGKVAIVTGASTGLGPVMARMLAEEGARVVMAARRIALVEEAAARIGEAAVAVQADVTQEADVAAMVDVAMDRWGQVDVMMNNAAVPGKDLYIWEQTLENWNATFAVDVTAAMLCSREVIRRSMLERRTGSIVNFSSTAGWNGLPRKSHYSAAKASVRVLTKVVAQEAGPHGIRCNCLVPGQIETDLLKNWFARTAQEEGISVEEKRAAVLSGVALTGVISTPEDVAKMALFLASDDARTITGQSINVDAGGVMIG
ncbi:SDR family oxidoreductase [Sphingobium sufflavum]|uniref:SDR family NAD(P)-dependent oxidoreductase n=1 Tax=Sphingobium sufflavum TaxID=1129547 RepID=UPI001F269912|nr:SDR family oxidoreductase [Sphingobium sufflavum]MCE7798601.1 SDR family oxidoreductase [Sphingobium sufflavum]